MERDEKPIILMPVEFLKLEMISRKRGKQPDVGYEKEWMNGFFGRFDRVFVPAVIDHDAGCGIDRSGSDGYDTIGGVVPEKREVGGGGRSAVAQRFMDVRVDSASI